MTTHKRIADCCSPTCGMGQVGSAKEFKTTNADLPTLVRIEAGTFLMGSHDPLAHPLDGEGPIRAIELDTFEISTTAMTNAAFAQFVSETGYVTEAERFGSSAVFAGFVDEDLDDAPQAASLPWWRRVYGASWRKPEGHNSDIASRMNHPVVHVSHNDVLSYCSWAGVRLPTEAEWECAARGGLVQKRYPWGDDLTPEGNHRCNIWQGTFPEVNTAEDGYAGTAPVASYAPNGFGMFNMVGNTWEWCSDWFDPSYHARATFVNPLGPPSGRARVIRGGSYLCHISYCARYRTSARSSALPNTATGHLGFRVARSV